MAEGNDKGCRSFLRPSSASQQVIDTEETKKPRLIVRSASAPAFIVSGLELKSAISVSGQI